MAEVKKEDFFKHLDNLTVLELADYIKEFETPVWYQGGNGGHGRGRCCPCGGG